MTRAKQATVVIAQPAAAGLADELKGLAALHQQGVLTRRRVRCREAGRHLPKRLMAVRQRL
jgi:hypothetical protein